MNAKALPPAPRGPRLLALDTSTETMFVAVVDGDQQWAGQAPGGMLSSQQLLPLVFAQLDQAGLTLADLDAVAFGQGPGAFTGLRTACSVAQGLALGAQLPVLPLDSLALVAEDAFADVAHRFAQVWVAMDARMEEVYAAAYRRGEAGWQAASPPALWPLASLAAAWRDEPPLALAGSALAAFGERLPTAGAHCVAQSIDRPAALARLARMAWQRGLARDAALALPQYLRDKVALTTAERAAIAAAKTLQP